MIWYHIHIYFHFEQIICVQQFGISEGTFDQAGFTIVDVMQTQEQNVFPLATITIIALAIGGVAFLILVLVGIIVGWFCM